VVPAVGVEVLRERGSASEEHANRQRRNEVSTTETHGDAGSVTLSVMAFFQVPPSLGNQFTTDRMLRSYLDRVLPSDVRSDVEPELADLGARAGGDMYASLLAGWDHEPRLIPWDPWGHRVDQIEITDHWKTMKRIAAEKGVVATAYERKHGEYSRIHQFALVYLFEGSSGTYSCPLAMTDGAAKTLTSLKNAPLLDRALPRLTSRDPESAWTSGQWMTERTGGSDVAISETVARKVEGTADYRLFGTKWFSSATTAEMALTLARPEGNPPGGPGLAMFYVETRGRDGTMNGIGVNRLKDKLGTRMLPTAELTLNGALATPVHGLTDGIRHITPMLSVTRTWNAVCAVSGFRRGLALARDYSKRRVAFGAPLSEKPLHVDTLAGLEAEFQGAFLLAFRAVELLGREEAGVMTEAEAQLLRMLTPIVKLTTAKQTVAAASEILETFGGAGYVEDTGIPRLLRDSQVLPIWEGTTNVLSLDLLRALGKSGTMDPLIAEVRSRVEASEDPVGQVALDAIAHAQAWLGETLSKGRPAVEAGARRFAITLGRAIELALLVDHGAWCVRQQKDGRTAAAARRFARHGIDFISDVDDMGDASALANDDLLAAG
jgi:acyl-CoA dehydrogenase